MYSVARGPCMVTKGFSVFISSLLSLRFLPAIIVSNRMYGKRAFHFNLGKYSSTLDLLMTSIQRAAISSLDTTYLLTFRYHGCHETECPRIFWEKIVFIWAHFMISSKQRNYWSGCQKHNASELMNHSIFDQYERSNISLEEKRI